MHEQCLIFRPWQIGDAKANENSMKREEQLKERLEYLCRSFPGVRGRVMDLCKVRQRQYELAITVVMESNMDAVVVDREETVKRSAAFFSVSPMRVCERDLRCEHHGTCMHTYTHTFTYSCT
jgi:hypothetical protein